MTMIYNKIIKKMIVTTLNTARWIRICTVYPRQPTNVHSTLMLRALYAHIYCVQWANCKMSQVHLSHKSR